MKTKDDYIRLPEIVEELNGVGIPQMTAKLIKRTDKKAIYYRWDNVWEVFRIKITEAGEAFGKMYPRREVYPGNEDFGKTAWCYSEEKNAWRMYNSMPDKLV
jgi:hypothetical protein